jgi:hypothetical protein
MIELLLPCGFDTLKYSWVKVTIGICMLVDYFVANKCQQGSTKKLMLLISLCMVQTADSVTWPLDHLAIEYPTCAWPSPVLCTRSPTPATVRSNAHHKKRKRDSPNETKIKIKQLKCPGFKFKSRQVNDSSQSNQGTDHLIYQSPPWWVHWQQKAQCLKFESKTPWSATTRQKAKNGSRRSSKRRKNHRAKKRMKSGKPIKIAKKS